MITHTLIILYIYIWLVNETLYEKRKTASGKQWYLLKAKSEEHNIAKYFPHKRAVISQTRKMQKCTYKQHLKALGHFLLQS